MSHGKRELMPEVRQMRKLHGGRSLEAMADMNRAVMNICIDSIRAKKPKISEKELVIELKKIYRNGDAHERIR